MRIRSFFLIFLISCNSNADNKELKIESIDSVVFQSNLIHHIITDTTFLEADTIYTCYEYDKPNKLKSIDIEETATTNKYVSYINNDTLIKIVVNNRNPNYSSDQAAAYYIDHDEVIKKKETRGKLEDIQKFINDQKKNIRFFKDTLTARL